MPKNAKLMSKPAPQLRLILAGLFIAILAGCSQMTGLSQMTAPIQCSITPPVIEPIDIDKAVISTPDKHYYVEGGQVWSDDQLAALMLYINDLVRCGNGDSN